MMPQQRDQSIDCVKGVLIILVVFGHIAHVGWAVDFLQFGTDWAYTFHMSAFLLISGFFTHARKSWSVQVVRIFRRLFVPYVIFALLYLFSRWFAGRHGLQTSNGGASIVPADLFRGLLFANVVGPIWYLYVLFIFQFIYYTVIYFWPDDRIKRWCVMAAILSLLGSTGIPGMPMTLKHSLYLLIGLFLQEMGWPLFAHWAYIVLFAAVGFAYPLAERYGNPLVHLAWVIGIFGVSHQLFIKLPSQWFLRVLSFVGRNTLIILILHSAVINAGKLARPFLLHIDASGISYSLFVTLAGVVLPMIFAWVCDRLIVSPILFGIPRAYSPFYGRGHPNSARPVAGVADLPTP